MNSVVYCISDAHLGQSLGNENEREKRLFDFLRHIPRSGVEKLYILGDFFDFWIEYRHAIRPDYFQSLHELKKLTDAGVEIHYLAGNHDFALGPFLRDEIGIKTYPGRITATLQGRTILMMHGDGILRRDHGYRFLHTILRSRLNQRLYKMLHPGIGVPLARFFSHTSRRCNFNEYTEPKRREYLAAARKLLAHGTDIVLFAHTHFPEIISIGTRYVCNTGDWISHRTYARLCNGELTLWRYLGEGDAQQIQPIVEK